MNSGLISLQKEGIHSLFGWNANLPVLDNEREEERKSLAPAMHPENWKALIHNKRYPMSQFEQ